MNAGSLRPFTWPVGRWWFLVTLVFVLQVAAIYFLSDNRPALPRPAHAAPTLHFSGNTSGELLALTDPTLFALPHRESFSGSAWLNIPSVPTASFTWTEPPQWLAPPTNELGASFHRALESYAFDPSQVDLSPDSDVALPDLGAGGKVAHSTFHLAGDLAGRRLLKSLRAPDWANNDILTNTIVRILVNAEGSPISAAVLSSSGLKAADDYAREEARSARFNSVATRGPHRNTNSLAGLAIGEIVFEWQTIPQPQTNSAAPPKP